MDGKIVFWFVFLPVAWLGCVSLNCVSVTAQTADAPASTKPDARFLRWDKNKDMRLMRDELPSAIRGNFDRVDTDQSGWISLDEHFSFFIQASSPGQVRPKALFQAAGFSDVYHLIITIPHEIDPRVF